MSEHGPALWTGSGKRSVQATEPSDTQAEPPAAPEGEGEPTVREDFAPVIHEQPTEPVEATDAAKALAAENNIDLATITGTGAGGRVTQDDVKALLPDA